MKITKENYFNAVKKIGFENLPMVLKQSHTVILTKTVNGEDWSNYKNDAELKRMIDLVFKKLEEFIKSQKENLSGAEEELNRSVPQVPYGKETDVDYHYMREELLFINRFLKWNNESITKKELLKFIDDLQSAILNRRIRKSSKLASTIKLVQEKSLAAYNGLKGDATKISFQPETLKVLNDAIKTAKEKLPKKLPKQKEPKKIGPVQLTGIAENEGKIMNSIDFTNLEFSSIGLKDKWLDFIGDPAPGFTAMVYGKPKMGKSYLCVDFAGYLARNHGKVLYVAKEEKLDATLQKKLKDKDVANDNLFVSDNLPKNLSEYQFVILDSVNKLGLNPEDLGKLKINNPGVCFIYVFQTTKEGKFRGTNEFQHDVDVVIEVPEKGIAIQNGRFNQGGEMRIFDDAPAEETEELSGIKKNAKKINPSKKKKTTKAKDWTEPEWLNEADWQNLKTIKKYVDKGDFKSAMNHAMNCDTVIREEIPSDIWKKMGGQLTKTGEEKLKAMKDESSPKIAEQIKKPTIVFNHGVRALKGIIEREWDLELTDAEYIEILDIAEDRNSKFADGIKGIDMNLKEVLITMREALKEWDSKNKRSEKSREKFDPRFYANRKDDDNPQFIFSLTNSKLLAEALAGDFDLIYLVRRELANRGQDKDGKWVGFDKAKEIHRL